MKDGMGGHLYSRAFYTSRIACSNNKLLGDEMVMGLRLYTEANDKNMRKHGVPTIKEQRNKILEMLTNHMEHDKLASENSQQKQGAIPELWKPIRPDKAINTISLLWSKVSNDCGTRILTHGLALIMRS